MSQANENIMELSDYSFLEQSVHNVYIWLWFILHVWKCDRFSALRLKNIMSLELKSFVTLFILFALPLGSFYDILMTKIKYTEGFYKFPAPSDIIRAKPRWLWSERDQLWFIPSYYVLMAGLSFQTITLFLLQCFWNYLTNSIAKTSFMSRGEFTFYILWGIISVAIYPVLPYVFESNKVWLESIPQLVYAIQLFFLVILGIRTHVKFLGLIKLTSSYKNSTNVIAKLRYFIDMNKLLTTSLAIMSVSFALLSVDLLTPAKIINNSKLASDLLAAHVNFAAVIEWLALILIFYPRKGFVGTGAGGSSFNTNMASSNINQTSQFSNTNSMKLSNVPPGTGAGINNEKRPKSPSVNPSNDNYQTTIKTAQVSPDYNNNYNNNIFNNNNNNNGIEDSQKQSSINLFKKKSLSPIPSLESSNSDNDSNNEGNNNKSVNHLKRNISISRDGKMVYGDTKPLGKVKGAEFVAVEKADPSFIPSYYFSNELKGKNSNVVGIPPMLNNDDDDHDDQDAGKGSSSGSSGGNDRQGIMQGVVQQEVIVPQRGTIQENNEQDDDDDDEYFYAM